MASHAPIPQKAYPSRKGKSRTTATPSLPAIGRSSGMRPAAPSPSQDQSAGEQPETVVAAGKFKATCLQLLDAAEKGESITVTKRGKVVARLVPPTVVEKETFVPLLGLMKGKVKILGDIVSPDFEAWGMEDPYKAKKKKH